LFNHFSHGFLFHLLGSLKDIVHALEALFPAAHFNSDGLPFFFAYLSKHVAVNDQFFINLVDLTIDNSVRDGFDGPFFNVILRNLWNKVVIRNNKTYIKERSDFSVLEVGSFFGTQLTDLEVALL
jgi:hypothetical protein